MPRKARTQAPVAPQDQGYGQRGEQLAAQAAMPLPDNRTPAPVATGAGQAPVPRMAPEDLVAMMKDMPPPPPGGLARPTERPDQPVTAGLTAPVQPSSRNRAAEVMEMIAATTGDQRFTALAQRARNI